MPTAPTQILQKALDCVDFTLFSGPKESAALARQIQELDEAPGFLALDTETTGLDPLVNQVRLVQLAKGDSAVLVDLDGWRPEGVRRVDWELPGLRELRAIVEGECPKVIQNAAFDLNFLYQEGLFIGGFIFDTMIASKIFYNGQTQFKNDLGSISNRILKIDLSKELQKADWSQEHTAEMLQYAAKDVVVLPKLVSPLTQMLSEKRTLNGMTLADIFQLEISCLVPVALMQAHGFGFDREGALELQAQLSKKAEEMKFAFCEALDTQIKQIHPDDPDKWLPRDPDGQFNLREKDSGSVRLGTKLRKGFNPRSNQQMAQKFEDGGILLPPNEKGISSLDQNLLAFVRNQEGFELVNQYMEWKKVETLLSHIEKLLDSIGPDGRIHCCYRQMGTDTGRLSASGPNLQQTPRNKEFRRLFRARPGYKIVAGDFSQVELRVAGELSGEENILAAYRAGRDLHTETAALMKGISFSEVTPADRTSAKISNFGLLYGAGPATLQKQAVAQYGLDMEESTARELVQGFREAYPTLYRWQQDTGSATTMSSFTKIGRRRILKGGRNDKYTTRINTEVQGTAGDIAKIAIAIIYESIKKAPKSEAFLISMCHDELVLEVRGDVAEKWAQILKQAMERAGSRVCKLVPIVAEVSFGDTWGDAK